MKYFNDNWQIVGTKGFSLGRVFDISLAIDGNGNPYIAYQNSSTNSETINNSIEVMKFDGNNWQTLGTTNCSARYDIYNHISLVIDINHANTPYVAYEDSTYRKAAVIKYINSNWQAVGTSEISTGMAPYVSLAVNTNGIPYVSYIDDGNNNKATVMKFANNSWQTVGTSGFSTPYANYTSLAIDSSDIP